MEDRVAVIARFKAKQGKDLELKELLLTIIEPSRADEGCISYDLHQAIDDPAVFMFYEIWRNKDLLGRHSTGPHLQAFRSKAKDLLAEPPEVIQLKKIGD